jgi:hypothetical protein
MRSLERRVVLDAGEGVRDSPDLRSTPRSLEVWIMTHKVRGSEGNTT